MKMIGRIVILVLCLALIIPGLAEGALDDMEAWCELYVATGSQESRLPGYFFTPTLLFTTSFP
jgi:hypothetical protein